MEIRPNSMNIPYVVLNERTPYELASRKQLQTILDLVARCFTRV